MSRRRFLIGTAALAVPATLLKACEPAYTLASELLAPPRPGARGGYMLPAILFQVDFTEARSRPLSSYFIVEYVE